MSKKKPNQAPPPPSPALLAELRALSVQMHADPPAALDRARALAGKHPQSPHPHTLAATIAQSLAQTNDAHDHARRAASLDPKNPDTLAAAANTLAATGDPDAALELLDRALTITPDHPSALGVRGAALALKGRYSEARAALERAATLAPPTPELVTNRALLELDTASADRAIEILAAAPGHTAQTPSVLDLAALATNYSDTTTPEQSLAAHQRYARALESATRPRTNHPNTPDPDRTLRVAYLSPDLLRHSIAYFLEPLLAHHDPEQVETHLLAASPHRDDVTDRLAKHAHAFHDVHALPATALADRIAELNIDILVELSGHFAGHRLPTLAHKPAPVQVSYLGYANTTALTAIDARLVDSTTDPEPDADRFATETLVRLDPCFLCYQPDPALPDPADPDPSRPFTFASFNDLKKLTPTTLDLWTRLLNEHPSAHLLLKAPRLDNPETRDDITNRFSTRGLDPSRLTLHPRTNTHHDHLNLYNQADAALDTSPYTGTTTTCEALSMGVPVLTLTGHTHASRVSASLLCAANLPHLVATTPDELAQAAAKLVAAGPRPRADRLALRDQLLASPLTDAPAHAARVEAAYRSLWKAWCEQQWTTP